MNLRNPEFTAASSQQKVAISPALPAPAITLIQILIAALSVESERMRGRLVELRKGKVTITAGSRIPGISGASFVELVNREVNGEYWLPAFQRTEIQARIALFGDFRTIVRIVSRFEDYRPNDSSWTGPETPPACDTIFRSPQTRISSGSKIGSDRLAPPAATSITAS